VIDADSHLMEWPGFLTDHADRAIRDRLPPITGGLSKLDITLGAHTEADRVALEALGDQLIKQGPKWHAALGAIDPRERSTALDLLGFTHQIVFSSLCAGLFDIADPEVRYGAYRAHNRAMASFCTGDRRLSGVAMTDLDDVDRAIAELDAAVDLGLRLLWLPARAPGGRAPGHHDHDRFWARLAELGVPFVLHVGSGPLPIGAEWLNDGRPPAEQMTGAEVINAKDFMAVHHSAQRFLGVLVLDGVLERHRGLHGGAIEIGAGWVPDFLRRLDHAVSIWSRSEPRLAGFERTPTQQAIDQLRFTPYPFEDVGRFVAETDPRLYLFSSDYPHAEGGRDPLGRFERSLAAATAADVERFLAGNAADWLGVS
jgi:predicted TIM-barrel fold metal-dependent hydrolase